MISQITAAGVSPAILAKSTLPSVWPVRTKTPPSRARNGNTCPGLTISADVAPVATAALIVVKRSWAEIPVETPSAASIETVKAVSYLEALCLTIMGIFNVSINLFAIGKQIKPRASTAIKLIISGVILSAAITKSPSFSRSSSSTRIISSPLAICSIASLIGVNGVCCITVVPLNLVVGLYPINRYLSVQISPSNRFLDWCGLLG